MLVHYRQNRSGAEETVNRVADLGCRASSVAGDIAKDSDRQRIVGAAFDRLGDVQTWVNNAGSDVLTGAAGELDFVAKLRRLIEVDVEGTIHLSRLVAERLIRAERDMPASMTFIGWDQALRGMEGDAGQMFAPVKAAVMAFADSMAQSYGPAIRVNSIAPGWIQTSWGQAASDYWDARAKEQSLMNRWGKPEDVSRAVVFAADPGNTFLTGQTIEVNGGWNRRYSP